MRVRPEDGKPWTESIVQKAASTVVSGPNRSSIPIVRTTQPGDEIKDFEKYKAAQRTRSQPEIVGPETSAVNELSASFASRATNTSSSRKARQFHLTRDLSTTLRPHSSGGIRKSKYLRPHLPTFIERLQTAKQEDFSLHAKPPVDRIIKSTDRNGDELELQKILSNGDSVLKAAVPTFQKPKSNKPKTGRSVNDDPDTWDLQSDQLADELLALALELDPDAKAAYTTDSASSARDGAHILSTEQMNLDQLDDFVYETYIRVQQNTLTSTNSLPTSPKVGYLVIDEEEEELWDQYLREEDDSEDDWDEEDADSNGRKKFYDLHTF